MFLNIRRRVWSRFVPMIALGLVGVALACGIDMAGQSDDVICVAASVRDAVAEIFLEDGEVVLAAGSSGSLRAAIANGAPCEVFVSASVVEVNRLRDKGLVVTSSKLLGNRLVVAQSLPKASKKREKTHKEGPIPDGTGPNATDAEDTGERVDLEAVKEAFEVLDSEGLIAIGNPSLVPAGRYAEAWLESVGLLTSLQSRLVFTVNARATLAAVESGSVRTGIVYATDAAISSRVTVVGVIEEPPGGFGDAGPIMYVAALLGDAQHPPSSRARELYLELKSPRAAAVFEAAGFEVLPEEASPEKTSPEEVSSEETVMEPTAVGNSPPKLRQSEV